MNDAMTDRTRVVRVTRIGELGGKSAACLVVCVTDEPGAVGRRIALGDDELFIGRAVENGVVVEASSVSRKHARVSRRGGVHVLSDCGSANGTLLNDEFVQERELRSGDLIKVGPAVFKYLGAGSVEGSYLEEVYRLTITDGLTGVANRRALDERLEREVKRATRYQRPLAVMVIDVDRFKGINDKFGHMFGDRALQEVARVVPRTVREEDFVARWGGEEFVVVLPETTGADAVAVAEKVRAAVEDNRVLAGEEIVPVTVSIGVAAFTEGVRTAAELLRVADGRMYEAKQTGRNRVIG